MRLIFWIRALQKPDAATSGFFVGSDPPTR